jgi:succinate dehydrogenase/fumarate reductase iron-sulfur protein
MNVNLKIRRQSSECDSPWLQEYHIDAQPNWSILDCLQEISRRLDASLAYRENCFSAVCGECGVLANGKETLACANKINDFPLDAAGVIRVDLLPLRNHVLVRDLVVDRESHFQRLTIAGDVFCSTGHHELIAGEAMREIQTVTACLNCGLCDSSCPVEAERGVFLGPAALVWALRFALDPRDGERGVRRGVLDSPRGLSGCIDCGACSEVCPAGVPVHHLLKSAR